MEPLRTKNKTNKNWNDEYTKIHYIFMDGKII